MFSPPQLIVYLIFYVRPHSCVNCKFLATIPCGVTQALMEGGGILIGEEVS